MKAASGLIIIRNQSSTELIARVLWGVLGAYMISAAVFQHLQSGSFMIPVLAAIVALATTGLLWTLRQTVGDAFLGVGRFLASTTTARWLIGCIAIGIALRVGCAVVFPSNYVSDTLAYWNLAQQLAAGEPYGSESARSFLPPGLPFALTPFIVVFGAERWVPVLVNLLLFIGTVWCAMHLAQRTAVHCTGRLAVLILAIWPNLVLLAGAPHKELLAAFLLPMAVLFYCRIIEVHALGRQPRWSDCLGCGVCLGFAALTQPAAALFGTVFVGLEASVRAPLRRKVARLALVGFLTILTVLPWTIRNYAVLGDFVPINTAGGDVLYSANNPHATGGWIPPRLYTDSELRQADEVTRDRLSRNRAFSWIRENKIGFLKLAILKHIRFLCCDAYGALLLFKHPDLTLGADPMLALVSSIASNAYWILLALLILSGAIVDRGFVYLRLSPVISVLLGVWYFLAIFSVFQSEAKHHVNAATFIAVIASWAVAARDSARRTDFASQQVAASECGTTSTKTGSSKRKPTNAMKQSGTKRGLRSIGVGICHCVARPRPVIPVTSGQARGPCHARPAARLLTDRSGDGAHLLPPGSSHVPPALVLADRPT